MSTHKFGAVLAALCAAALIVPVAAGAQTLPSGTNTASLTNIPVSGVAKNHKRFDGQFAVDRFVSRRGKTFAVGTLTGKLGNKRINRSNVAMPASVATGSPLGAAHDMFGAAPRARPRQPKPAGFGRHTRWRFAGESADCPRHYSGVRTGQPAREPGVQRVESAQRNRGNAIDVELDRWLAQPRQHTIEHSGAG